MSIEPNSVVGIPAELKRLPQWVTWRRETDGRGGITKIPFIAGTDRRASSADPSTWTDFDAALAKSNGDAGLGFVFTREAGIIGIDIDGCRNPTTEEIALWALKIVERLASYAEISPSGTGLHIMVGGTLPSGARRKGCVETYCERRFFTTTGQQLPGTPNAINRTDLAWLHKLMTAGVFDFEKHPRLRRLLDGDSTGYASRSEADLALCAMLASLGLDSDAINDAFCLSGLWRDKWTRDDYRTATISKALEGRLAPRVTAVAPAGADWQKRLLRGKDGGSPLRLLANACLALREAPEFSGVLGFDEFAGVTVTRCPAPWQREAGIWTEDSDRHLAEWLQLRGIGVHSKIAAEAAETVAREHAFHPVKQYLESLTWDGVERTDLWMPCCLGSEDTAYTRAVGARILIAAVARIYEPGCQCDSLPVLQGPQGIMKSSVIRELFSATWFSDHISDLGSKDSRVELRGKWCIEISELSAMRRGEIEAVKAYISCRSDNYRPPYGIRRVDVLRSCVFFGTTNDDHPFTDPTGSRRFWPIRCGVIDLEAVRGNRDAMWAEAVLRYRRGDARYLETRELTALAQEAQAQCYEAGARDELIEQWVENPTQRTPAHEWDAPLPWFGSEPRKINATDVLVHGLGLTKAQIKSGDSREVGRCLKHLGYEYTQERSGLHRGRRYYTKGKQDER